MRTKMAQPRMARSSANPSRWLTISAISLILSFSATAAAAPAQKTQSAPATDSSVQASPIKPAPAAPVNDSSSQASPITPVRTGSGPHLAPHTTLPVRLSTGIDSGRLTNGQTVHATLSQPVALSTGRSLPAGTPVDLTVVETLPAGRLYAVGEFSLQVVRVGSVTVSTDTLTFRGKPGHKDLPDSAPAVGTDAGLAAGAALTFHVLPPPSAATRPDHAGRPGPGAVNGVASGSPPPPGSSPSTQQASQTANSGNVKGPKVHSVQPAENTPGRVQSPGKTSAAPNQPVPPQNATPTDATQPR
ncbi:MAG TPA: hypothetical protein VIJ65_07915 [Acidobacteriaceae bacterium]